jgi:hypothetical protein
LKAIIDIHGHPNLFFPQVDKVKKFQIKGKVFVREYDFRFAHFIVLRIEEGVPLGQS